MMMIMMIMMMMMIAGHPHHRRERETETETLRPSRILVAAQLDRLEGDDVEDEDAEHDEGGEVLPAEVPEDVRLVPGHLLDAVTEPGLTDEKILEFQRDTFVRQRTTR